MDLSFKRWRRRLALLICPDLEPAPPAGGTLTIELDSGPIVFGTSGAGLTVTSEPPDWWKKGQDTA